MYTEAPFSNDSYIQICIQHIRQSFTIISTRDVHMAAQFLGTTYIVIHMYKLLFHTQIYTFNQHSNPLKPLLLILHFELLK